MKDAQKPDHLSLTALVGRLKDGRFVVPNFQREFEWMPWDIQDLMRSIFLDYFIGSLLLWKGKPESFDALACEAIYGYEGSSSPEHIVLDGQQRLTAMFYAFTAPKVNAPNRSNRYLYFIRVDRFMEEEYDEAFTYEWTQRGVKILEDRGAQFAEHMFPLSVVGESGWALANWVQDYEQYWVSQAEDAAAAENAGAAGDATRRAADAKAFGELLKGITEQYQIAYIELDRDLELDKVCDIFTQINSKGIRLDIFDLINALLTPKGLVLKHLWREAAPTLDFVDTERMNVYVLQVMSILLQAYCSPKYLYFLLPGQQKLIRDSDGSFRKEVLVSDVASFEQRWTQAVGALQRSIELLRHPQEYGAISSQYLPYVSILPAFAALQVQTRALDPKKQLDAQRKVRHWYWSSVFTNRYSGSVESTAARDFLSVRSWFEDDAAEPSVIAEFRSRFRTLDLRNEVKRGSSIYNGIFNLLVIRGARDWMTNLVPQYGDLDDHHIVPKRWGQAQNGLGSGIDTILNRTPLTASTNRHVIRDRLPNVYLPELIAENGEATVRATLESHFISRAAFDVLLRDPFTVDDFQAFIGERQRTLQDAIEDLLIKGRLDLSAPLRELDVRIEHIELGLRSRIAEAIVDPEAVPGHIRQRVVERIQSAAQKNAAFDLPQHQTLPGMLEFFDLRELQDTIVFKPLWPRFEAQFVNKQTLAVKFDQLAELRNGIRHSRAVDDIARKEGEAAVLWFEQLLAP